MSRFTVSFGAFAPPIKEQLEIQRLTAPKKDINIWQRMSDGLTLLAVHGILTGGEMDKAGNRLAKKISAAVQKGGES